MLPTENEDTGKNLYSRRGFFGIISHLQQGDKEVGVDQVNARAILYDNLVEKFGEAVAFLIIMASAYDSSRDQLVTYNVDSESKQKNLNDFNEKLRLLNEMGEQFSQFYNALNTLSLAWNEAYEEERQTCVSDTESKGRTCTIYTYIADGHMKRKFNIDHNTIAYIKRLSLDITQNIGMVLPQVKETFDLSRGEASLFYQEIPKDLQSGKVEAVMLYGLVGFAFLFYEEILKSAATLDRLANLPRVEEHIGIKRRTFVKVLAAFIGAIYLQQIQIAFVSKNSQLLANIKEHARKVVAEMNVDPEANFERFFGYNLEEMFKMLIEFRNKLQNIIDSGYEGERILFWNDAGWLAVKTQIINCLEKISNLITYLEMTFPNHGGKHQIPDDLTEVTQAIWATHRIQLFVQNQSLKLDLRHFIDAGLLGLFFAGVAVATEKIIIPATNRRDLEN